MPHLIAHSQQPAASAQPALAYPQNIFPDLAPCHLISSFPTLTSTSPAPSSSSSSSADTSPSDGIPLTTWHCVPHPRLSIDKVEAERLGACRKYRTAATAFLVAGRGQRQWPDTGTRLLVSPGSSWPGSSWRRYCWHVTGGKSSSRFQPLCGFPSESNWLCSCCSRL